MLKIYKFRPLGDEDSLRRAKQILETGEFWCSRFWDLNDPMEGVYLDRDGLVKWELAKNILGSKASRVICSFSGRRGFERPEMWGYYANGFKGFAVEVEVDLEQGGVFQVAYKAELVTWRPEHDANGASIVDRILTTKLSNWQSEDEYRFLSDSEKPCYKKVGRITGVYFGRPYGDLDNALAVHEAATSLTKYQERAEELGGVARCRKIKVASVRLVGSSVIVASDPDRALTKRE